MKKKISKILIASMMMSNSSPVLNVYASEVMKKKITAIEKSVVNKASINKFDLNNYENFDKYNEKYKVQRSEILSIKNNGGQYASSSIDKAIDGDLATHWETGKQNSSNFTNEVVVEFNNLESINRIAYATRQDGAKGKGYPTQFEIYASKTDNDSDFELVSHGESNVSGNLMEFKFDKIEAKKIKFVFKAANQNWASASEFWFYKEDKLLDKMDRLFKDETMSQVADEFNSLEKLNELENEVKEHPFYNYFKESINDAREIINENKVEVTKATTRIFNDYSNEEYSKLFKMDNKNIKSIKNNGGHYSGQVIENSIDGNIDTYWETNKSNTNNFSNEVEVEFNEAIELNRVVYGARKSDNKGFAKEFEIYGSKTSKGDTFNLIATGEHNKVSGLVEAKFNPTKFKRIKFKFKNSDQNWATLSELAFYKQDELSDKMERLFIDNKMDNVSEEFNSLEKLEKLEEEAKKHPRYNYYKEDLENAKLIVENKEVQYTDAKVSSFLNPNNELLSSYDAVYKLDKSKIKSIKTNGGHYASEVIEKSIDGDFNTKWHSGKQNNSEFKNEVVIELNELTPLNRVVYTAPRGSNRGFAEAFDIYASRTSKGDKFEKVTSGKANITQDSVEIRFNTTEFKRIKFVFKKGYEDWACASEFGLYKEDKTLEKVQGLFKNGLMNELSEEFNTEEKLKVLEDEMSNHPLKTLFEEKFELAHKILKGELENVKIITAEQHGDMVAHASKNLKFGFGNNNQPTGIYAKPGETITVYVDADSNEPLPKLAFSQQEGSFGNWLRTVSLKPGKNVITVPEISKDQWYKHDVTKGGPVYIVNPYTSKEQSKAPVLRFATGHKFPFVTKDSNVEEFKNFLIEYKKKIDEDVAKHPNVLDREVIDVFEFVSDHIVWTGTATGAYETYIEKGVNPLDTIKSYNTHMEELFKYYALDGSNEKNDPKYIRENVRLAQPFGYMYAATGHIGVQKDVMANHLIPFEDRGPSWGLTHEIGHKMDINARVYGEVTNNMLPMYMSVYYNKIDKRIPYESEVYKNVISENSNKYTEGGYFENLAVYWQLEMYKPGYWGKLNRLYRERDVDLGKENPNNVKMQYLIKFSSEVIGEDLSEYFARHGFEVNEETKKETSKYKKPDKKIWYLNDSKVDYKGNGFTKDPSLELSLSRVGNGIKLNFNVDDEVKSDLLGYEILKDGEVIGFTSTNSFVDTKASKNKNSKYEVIPYDINLGKGKEATINSFAPSISLQQKKITLKLGEEFNPLEYVKVLGYKGDDLTSKVKVEEKVDTKKPGIYEVKYTSNDKGMTTEKILEVEVVSEYDYLSDEEWKNVETQWGTPRRNTNIKGRVNGEIKNFEKGFGIHANGKITYDLSGKEYDNFEALLGVDGGIEAQNNSSIKFEIIADGKTLANTEVLKHADNMKYINVPVKGVKELVIKINDAGNGKTSDHGVIVNPKLTTNNAKPTITLENAVINVKDKFNILDGVTAKDAEDGDLTSSIKVKSSDFKENRGGVYTVVYEVSDKDGNTVTKERKIYTITNTESLSDMEWKKATSGWREVKKNKSVEGNTLTLLDEKGQEVKYDKGFGTHANSEIVYDLAGKNYGMFEAYVGVDREMRNSNASSVIFEVYVDGEKVFDSGLMKSNTERKHVLVKIAGASELKLVAKDGGNGNAADHADWADAKVYNTSDKPVLTGEEVALSIGEDFDPLKGIVANDPEDGDILNKVQIVNNNINTKRGGNYVVSYEVTDSHGNKVTLDRKISVANAHDYISDKAWESANSGWGSVRKDKSVENNTLTLLDENGEEVKYDKGIGTHSTSTIVYDLSKENYKFFEAYVGVDREMRHSNVSSISFEVYADGKKVFDSGLMNSNTKRKHILVPVVGVDKLKLVVKDGGNGNGGDHGDWADAKLLYVSPKDFTSLAKVVEEAKGLDGKLYTEESFAKLQEVMEKANKILETKNPEQSLIDSTTSEVRKAIDGLEKAIDLTEVVKIQDANLKQAIKTELNIQSDEITVGDMHKLTKLQAEWAEISNLEGMQYAINLESLNLNNNQIRDISKLKDLKKLKDVSIKEQYIVIESPQEINGKYIINESFIGKDGEKLLPSEINIRKNKGEENANTKNVNVENSLKDGNVEIDTKLFENGVSGIAVVYKDLEGKYEVTLSTLVNR